MSNSLDIQDIYTLTPMQNGILYHSKENISDTYFEQSCIKVSGDINIDILEKSFNLVIAQYDSIRSIFSCEYGTEPLQIVIKERGSKIYLNDIVYMKHDEKQNYIDDFMERDRKKGFDIYKDLLIRMNVIKYEEKEYAIILSFHHIILDGWSWAIVLQDIFSNYSRLMNNDKIVFGGSNKFNEYIKYICRTDNKSSLEFWSTYLKNYEDKSVRSYLHNEEKNCEYIRKEESFKIDEKSTSRIVRFAKNNNITLSSFFNCLWGILLSKYNDSKDVVFGNVLSGRNAVVEDIEKTVGICMNTVPIRVNYSEETDVIELLRETHLNASLINENSFSSISDIFRESNLSTDVIRSIVAFESYPIEVKNDEFLIRDVEVYEKTNYDLNLIIIPTNDIQISVVYNENSYDSKSIINLMMQYFNLIKKVIDNANIRVAELEIITENEKEMLLNKFNDTACSYPQKTIAELFEEVVNSNSSKIALKYEALDVTYAELDERADRIADALIKEGIRKKDVVAIYGKNSMNIIIVKIALLKIGAVCLPLDLAFPKNTIESIMNESRAIGLIDVDKQCDKLIIYDTEMSKHKHKFYYNDDETIKINNKDLAYILYTSGTTGKPKGVMIEHRNILRLVRNTNYIDFDNVTGMLQVSSIAFDASLFEIWGALLNVKTLYLVNRENVVDINLLKALVLNSEINTAFFTTSLFYQIVQNGIELFKNIKYVIVGGEKLNTVHVNTLIKYNKNLTVINVYGPTENTTFTTYYSIDKIHIGTIPIGTPINNSKVYVLDRYLRLQPIGAIGEIYIGGDGLSRGYINNDELTKKSFIDNPYIEGERIYKTGDLGRWLSDGNLEYLGRVDNQVKIRGYRIELGQIENQLLRIPNIRESVVVANEDLNGNKYLCAYVVGDVKAKVIKEKLLESLPEYMVPTRYMFIDEIPLNTNGKVDRKKLPKSDVEIINKFDYKQAGNEIEEKLVQIWQDILGVKSVGINDNFYDLGGDSIKAIQIVARLNKYNLEVKTKDIFQYPNIESLSRRVKLKVKEAYQGEVTGEVKLTAIQRWLFDKNDFDDCNHFNQGVLLSSTSRFDLEVIKQAFMAIINHHDALRMSFSLNEAGEIVQINNGICTEDICIPVIDVEGDVEEIVNREANKIQASIKLDSENIIKLKIFRTQTKDYLLIVIHHLVVDGVSWRIIFEDFNSVYKQIQKGNEIKLNKKTDSFKLWAGKINEYAESVDNEKLSYWINIDKESIKKIPKDNVINLRKQSNSMEIATYFTEEETNEILKNVNNIYSTNTEEILIAALEQVISSKVSGDYLINLEGHGREAVIEDIDINRTVGWFTSMYPVLIENEEGKDIDYRIKRVKETLRNISNKGLDYGINKYINKQNMGLEADISFNYLGEFDQALPEGLELSELKIGNFYGENINKEFAIDINAKVSDKRLQVSFGYDKAEFNEETIQNLINSYKDKVKQIINHCKGKTTKEITPSDLGTNSITIDLLEEIFEYIER